MIRRERIGLAAIAVTYAVVATVLPSLINGAVLPLVVIGPLVVAIVFKNQPKRRRSQFFGRTPPDSNVG